MIRWKETTKNKYYKTLNRDAQITNTIEGWDTNINKGDEVIVDGLESLKNACILAIITKWKEVKTPTYQDWGNKAHEVIKMNKSDLIAYRIQSNFKESLNSIRRVKKVNYVKISENQYHPYDYYVEFSVTSHDDTTVYGSTTVSSLPKNEYVKTKIHISTNEDYVNPYTPITVKIKITFGNGHNLSGEIVNIYADDNLITKKVTNENGEASFLYYPTDTNPELKIQAVYEGDGYYATCKSNVITIPSISFFFTQINGHLILVYSDDDINPPNVKLTEDYHLILETDLPIKFEVVDGELYGTFIK